MWPVTESQNRPNGNPFEPVHQIIGIIPYKAQPYFQRGMTYGLTKKFAKVINVKAYYYRAYMNRGDVRFALGNFDGAVGGFRQGIVDSPE